MNQTFTDQKSSEKGDQRIIVEKDFTELKTKLETKMEHLETRLGISMIAGSVVIGLVLVRTGDGHAPHS